MRRLLGCMTVVILGGLAALPARAQPPRGSGQVDATAPPVEPATPAAEAPTVAPQADVLRLTNGNTVTGYVSEATDTRVVFIKELRQGSFTRMTFRREQVADIVYAPPAARDAMAERIAWWQGKKSRDTAAARTFEVTPSTEHEGSWEAAGTHLRIICDVNAATTREMAFRLNSMYEQWLALFGRQAGRGAPPTRMFIVSNVATYKRIFAQVGAPAAAVNMSAGFYLPPPADVSVVPIQFNDAAATRAALKRMEQQYAGRMDAQAWDQYKRRIKSRLGTQRARQIATAYHEAMHAFISKELFPGSHAIPTWLNEGMASYVEMVREDVQGLRVEVVNPRIYPRARAAAEHDTLTNIRQLVGRRESITAHDTRDSAANFYAASWALVYFLNIERGALENDMYARYVTAIESGTEPIAAFEHMTGEPLARTEATWSRTIPGWK